MALFRIGMPCSLCGDSIRVGDEIMATTLIGDPTDPIERYSDSVMHRPCFDAWEHREEFIRRYKQVFRSIDFPGPRGYIVQEPPPTPPPPPPTHFCPQCHLALTVITQGECKACGWLKYPSDREKWGSAGICPSCGFTYRFDGTNCSHCGRSSLH